MTQTPGTPERRAGVSRFMHSGMKNADLQTNSSASALSQRRYDAFGDPEGNVQFYGAWTGPQKYAGAFGYRTEGADTSLDNRPTQVGHRWYEPGIGRFLSRDPAGSGRNWYSYCNNNPIDNTDPSGLDKIVIVYGDTSGSASLGNGIAGFFEPPIAEGDEVVRLRNPSASELEAALVDADQFWYWGHGNESGIMLSEEEWFGQANLDRVIAERRRKKVGTMKTTTLRACLGCANPAWLNGWLSISDEVYGYTDLTMELWGKPNPIKRWDAPVQGGPVTKIGPYASKQGKKGTKGKKGKYG